MISNFYIDLFKQPLTQKKMLEICKQLGGDTKKVSFVGTKIQSGILFGDFRVKLSRYEISQLFGCHAIAVATDKDFTSGKNVTLSFQCIVIQQDKRIVSLFEETQDSEGAPAVKHHTDIPIDNNKPLFLLFEKTPEASVNYHVVAGKDEDKDKTFFIFDWLPNEIPAFSDN